MDIVTNQKKDISSLAKPIMFCQQEFWYKLRQSHEGKYIFYKDAASFIWHKRQSSITVVLLLIISHDSDQIYIITVKQAWLEFQYTHGQL